jgi:hypothetical protein
MNRRNMLGIRLRGGAHHTAIHDLLGRCKLTCQDKLRDASGVRCFGAARQSVLALPVTGGEVREVLKC